MTPEQAFIDDIIAEPANNGLRLVFADWLEDNGQEARGEFIRVQIARAGEDPNFHGHLYQREQELLRRPGIEGVPCNGYRWSEPLHELGIEKGHWTGTCFRRGFLHTIRLPLAVWLEHGPALVKTQPLERVELSDKEPCGQDEGGDGYWWYDSEAPGNRVWWGGSHHLPHDLFRCLPGADEGAVASYETKQAALDALSAGCLAWACLMNTDPKLFAEPREVLA